MLNHQTNKRRRWSDSDTSHGGSGPGGAPAQPHPENSGQVELSAEDARSIEDFYLRGGATQFVVIRTQTIQQIRRMREAGLIETLQDVRGRDTAKLTVRGMQMLAAASQINKAGARGA